jgi:hypothetical protein
MSDTPDFNIENYTLSDLIELIDITATTTKEDIEIAVNVAVEKFTQLKQLTAATFFGEVGDRLIENFETIHTLTDNIDKERDVEEPGENLFQNQYYDSGKAAVYLADKFPNRKNNTSIVEDTNRMIQGQERLLIPNTKDIDITQGNLNPIMKNTFINIINVDSHYREINVHETECDGTIIEGSQNYLGTSTDFVFDLNEKLNNVISIKAGTLEIPMAWYPFSAKHGTNKFKIGDTMISIPEGFYDDPQDLITAINASLAAAGLGTTITLHPNTLKSTITDIPANQTIDFNPEDPSNCNINNIGAKIDYNLGWLLGFRQEKYPAATAPPAVPWHITSEGLINTFGTRYLLLKIEDFQANRLSNRMTSLTNNQNKFKTPSYYNRIKVSQPFCRDSSGTTIQKDGKKGHHKIKRACRKGTSNPNDIVDGSNNLTQAQKYTAQQILIARKDINQDRYFAPTDNDILLRFPISVDLTNSISRQMPFIYENDGQQKRTYFGPTTLKRLHVELLNDKGFPIDLNNMDFSFSLIVEQLYQY